MNRYWAAVVFVALVAAWATRDHLAGCLGWTHTMRVFLHRTTEVACGEVSLEFVAVDRVDVSCAAGTSRQAARPGESFSACGLRFDVTKLERVHPQEKVQMVARVRHLD